MSKLAGIMMKAATYPNDVRAQISAAYACEEEGKVEKSLQYFDAAWELGLPIDGRYRFYFAFGMALRKGGRLEEAEELFRYAIEEFPSDKAFPVHLALTLDAAGKSSEAVAELLVLMIRLRDKVVDFAVHKEELVEYLASRGRDFLRALAPLGYLLRVCMELHSGPIRECDRQGGGEPTEQGAVALHRVLGDARPLGIPAVPFGQQGG